MNKQEIGWAIGVFLFYITLSCIGYCLRTGVFE